MAVRRMNHAVLYVRRASRSARFYEEVLDFSVIVSDTEDRFAFLRAPASENHHDLALFTVGEGAGPSAAGRGAVGLYHLAWEVATLDELAEVRSKLESADALIGASDHGVNKSLYARDLDGIEFEVMWLTPSESWGAEEHEAIIRPLDIDTEIARFGGSTVSTS